jgi:3-hydroxybutyryl-CoA dehydratase
MRVNRRVEDLQVGDRFTYARTLSEGDSALFVAASGDFNPYHTDEAFARQNRFGRRIVPGLLTASLLTHIGGELCFLATRMVFEYLAPVYFGDTATAVAEIASIDPARKFVRVTAQCTNQSGQVVLRGNSKATRRWAEG